MSGMFSNAESFNQDIGNWNAAKVEDMAGMFHEAKSINQDIESWNVSSVEDMYNMFIGSPLENNPPAWYR